MKKFRLRDYLPVLIMVLCAVIFGVLLATGVMDLDTVPQLVADRPVLAVLVVPFQSAAEELVFRGLLAGRLARYGQKPGAFISALLFGLYHANLEQFFYAFALGLLLSYAYYRTGLLRTSVLLHMLFNIIGSVVPMLLPDTIAAQSALGLFWMAMLVIGMILLVRGRKQQVWLHGPCAPSLKAVLQTAGMFLLIVACFVQTVFNYL